MTFILFLWINHFKVIWKNTVGVTTICELPDRPPVRQNPKHMILNPISTVKKSISQIPHISFSREKDTGRQLLIEENFFFLQLSLFGEITIIKHGQLLWCLGIQRDNLLSRCWNLYWTFERTLHMPTHSLPTKGFMHVKIAQWMVPLVRNPRNNYETGSRVLGWLLVFWQFPTLPSLWCLSLMKWKAANRLPNSSAFFGFHVKWFFWDGLCSNVLCPFLKDPEEEHLCSKCHCAPSRAALFQQESSQHPPCLPLTNTAWTRELGKQQIILH